MKIITILLGAFLSFAAQAQTGSESKKWDVSDPQGPYKEVSFTVQEGTWMNLDVSPDGREIVFDLLGDIYSIPVTGGTAKRLRGGHAFEVQPRFSPDGSKISFTSDAGGGDNIWTMDRSGANPKQVTKENFRLLNNAVWTPDGQYLVARKHFTSGRSLGAGEMWLYHLSGGNGVQLTARKNDQQDVNEPCASADGRYIYFSEDMYPGGFFQYNKDPNQQIFMVRRFDRQKGKVENVTGGGGGAARPQVSHNGKYLSFVKRVRTKTVLYLRDLKTGVEWPVYDQLSKDQQEAWSIFGVYTGYAWSPDDRFIYIWAQGHIMKVDVDSVNRATIIPFTCQVDQKISNAVRFKQNLDLDRFKVNVIRQAVTSPDGKWLVFNAVGYLWKKALPNGRPQRITKGQDFELEPSFSFDGKQLLYITWDDEQSGAIYRMNLATNEAPVRLTQQKGIYRTPSFSRDSKKIVFVKESGSDALGPAHTAQPGIYCMDADGKSEQFVIAGGNQPVFGQKGDRIYYQSGGNDFWSCRLDGQEQRQVLKSTYGTNFTLSPDERWIAFTDLHKAYVAAFPETGKTLELSATTADFPVKLISRDAGYNLHWNHDSKQLHYTLGAQYFTIDLAARFEFIAHQPDAAFKIPEQGLDVGLEIPTDRPTGVLAFTNARIITMDGNKIIENGSLVVEGNKIKAVGSVGDVSIPAAAKVIDVTGKTILPGLIDAHAHAGHFRSGITPQKHWPYYAALAYGVTALHDPSANSEFVFANSELVKAGTIVGPRVFSTGTILYGADGDFKAVVNSLEDARSALRRTQAFGAFSVKSYNQPRREQRQQIIKAARELKMAVVPEGGSFFFHNTSMILDGHTTIEHNMPVATLHDDVIQLWKRSQTAYTPTLIVNYGSVSGEYYWYQHTNVWEKQRLMRFSPRGVIDARSRHRTMLPEEEYENGHILSSRNLKKLTDAGVLVNMGAHGQIQGIGAHWEIWMMAQGGMSPHEALKTATINPAKSLGLDDHIGSLEVGKLADLIVLDKNPLEDIYNTEFIKYTMANGRLYEAEQMNEIGRHPRTRSSFPWELYKNAGAFPWHDQVQGCGCGSH